MSTTQENIEKSVTCSQCNATIKAGAKFCPVCGSQISEQRVTCPQCNAPIKEGTKFCPACGSPVSGRGVQFAAAPQTTSAIPKAKNPPGKKRKLLIAAVLLIAILIIVSQMNNPVNLVKKGTLRDFGSQTVGEMVDDNFKNVKWSSEKLDNDSGFVYAKGYCVAVQENLSLKFYYDEDSGEFRLIAIDWLDSGESDTNSFSIALTLGMLYG